ncbi:MAG TPA: hypothetical protein VFV61_00585 [Pyrinomonadaceae bacterium]|nr:hypothetical protein [Pyrinomonadaceae bacterium]
MRVRKVVRSLEGGLAPAFLFRQQLLAGSKRYPIDSEVEIVPLRSGIGKM